MWAERVLPFSKITKRNYEETTNLANPRDQTCKHRPQGLLKQAKGKIGPFASSTEQQVLHQWDETEIQGAI